ncbi:MAG TPA: mannose-6-phosphate isomerase, class I [Armatimonadota bacterium]|jgi:mannose-6-phosphate isomerase class I
MSDNTSRNGVDRKSAAAPAVMEIEGAVQHYDWGGYEFIPRLLGIENTIREPYAELWIGAHPGAPSIARFDGEVIPLNRLIETSPDAYLGDSTAARFEDRLPYLFKVLDAFKMLSIQAHPSKAQAEEGFARENAAGIPLTASNRNYKDDNHKPEVHVALTDFWMLHGFRPLDEIAGLGATTPELAPVLGDFGKRLERAGTGAARKDLLRSVYGGIMALPQGEIDRVLNPLLARLAGERPSDKDSADYWALRAADNFPLPDGHRDRGIVSIYLLNLVHLKPGQGTYQPAGMLHAYLEGINVELMANSDNVLRGGLTPKHVDVAELMQTLTFESGPSAVILGDAVAKVKTVYRTPAAEFELSQIALDGGTGFDAGSMHGPDAVIVLEGAVTVESAGQSLDLKRGGIFFARAGFPYRVKASQPAVLFKASVPANLQVP